VYLEEKDLADEPQRKRPRSSNLRLWIAGGGTGGHVYPGLAVAQALAALVVENDGQDLELVYVGAKGKAEESLAARAGLPFVGVPAGGIHGLSVWRTIWNLTTLGLGWLAACFVGLVHRPAALFATGGYASIPAALAAWTLRVPILLYLPDIVPGWAVRFIARLATRVAVTVEDAAVHFSAHKVLVTGYPVRAEFHLIDRRQARTSLGLDEKEPVLLVMGGSTGAQGINRPFSDMLEQVLPLVQVVHVTGKVDWPFVREQRQAMPETLKKRYHIYDYVHDMGIVFAAADLAICRAGASILGELPFFGLPAILVPYPHAWDYQRINADWLVERGGAVRLKEEQLGDVLLPTLRRLLEDRDTLGQMAGQMRALACPNAATSLARVLLALAGRGRGEEL
jgi:UDP-N-acetylglucosamine--N-acetylmuramyl-(pentapeptide) pyrophosphoryl-undecaprenol N-acetylglucosamine transferase